MGILIILFSFYHMYLFHLCSLSISSPLSNCAVYTHYTQMLMELGFSFYRIVQCILCFYPYNVISL